MKPAKTKNTQEVKKMEQNAPTIQKYFQTAPKQFVVKSKVNNINESENNKAFYIQALKDKLKSYVVENDVEQQCEESQREDGACAIELDNEIRTKETHIAEDEVTVESKDWELKSKEWEMKSKEWEMKYKNLKKVYVQLTIRYSEQSLKFEHLLKSKTNAGNTTDHTTDHTTGHFPSPNTGIQVQSNDDIFTPRELIYLQCMSLDKSKDSTFIMKCLEFAYKNNLPILRFKTLKGKPESVQFDEGGEAENIAGKDPLTPMKVNRIKDLFLERLSKCQIDPVVYGERVKDSNINKLFASGVKNISKKHNE